MGSQDYWIGGERPSSGFQLYRNRQISKQARVAGEVATVALSGFLKAGIKEGKPYFI